jgi:hypothetical protein
MALRSRKMVMRNIAERLVHPEGDEEYQKAKADFTYRQMKNQRVGIGVQKKSLDVQKAAAEAQAKAADASIRGAKAAERNAKYMLASVIVAAIAAVFSAVSTGLSLWSVVHPR